ncbi:MAG: M23 family metallopeptidase [Clostridia bacterium]|nr:M23 family metallopeptidase [Clostridia bacterium]
MQEVRIKEADNLRKNFISVVAFILCISVVFGGSVFLYASAQEQEGETAVSVERDKSPWEVLSQTIGSLLFGGTQTDGIDDKADVRFPFIIAPFQDSPGFLTDIKSWLWIGTEVEVLDYWGNYAYVKCVETEEKGYIHTLCIDDPDPKLVVSKDYEHVYKDVTKTLAFSYNGAKKVECLLSKNGIIKCDVVENGIRITGLKPGTVKLTVKAGSIEKALDVHCVYKWEKPWTAVALTSTTIYKGPDESYGARASLAKDTRFVVKGDEGGSDGWAYGQIYNTDIWGFVRIEDISTKNTVSYYNGLNWLWPLQDASIKYISSTYGPRTVSTGSSNHRGIDVTTGIKGEIAGEPLVAPFNGIVKKAEYESSCGNYICISSEETDPVTGKKIIAIYMHMNSSALYGSQEKVSKGDVVGYVGTTGASSGYHLHMEANNMNAAVGDTGRSNYTNTINPLYFYMDTTPTFSNNASYQEHGGYWYNENK